MDNNLSKKTATYRKHSYIEALEFIEGETDHIQEEMLDAVLKIAKTNHITDKIRVNMLVHEQEISEIERRN